MQTTLKPTMRVHRWATRQAASEEVERRPSTEYSCDDCTDGVNRFHVSIVEHVRNCRNQAITPVSEKKNCLTAGNWCNGDFSPTCYWREKSGIGFDGISIAGVGSGGSWFMQ